MENLSTSSSKSEIVVAFIAICAIVAFMADLRVPDIDPQLKWLVKVRAAQLNISLREFIIDALRAALAQKNGVKQ